MRRSSFNGKVQEINRNVGSLSHVGSLTSPPPHNKSYEPAFGTTSVVAFVLHTKGLSEHYPEHYCPNISWWKWRETFTIITGLYFRLMCFSNKGKRLNTLARFHLWENIRKIVQYGCKECTSLGCNDVLKCIRKISNPSKIWTGGRGFLDCRNTQFIDRYNFFAIESQFRWK